MPMLTLEQRIAALEKKVCELETVLVNGEVKRDWERTIGMFAGDEYAKRVDEQIMKAREAERRKARRGPSKGRTRKKARAKA